MINVLCKSWKACVFRKHEFFDSFFVRSCYGKKNWGWVFMPSMGNSGRIIVVWDRDVVQ